MMKSDWFLFLCILLALPFSSSQVGTWVYPLQVNQPTSRYYFKMIEHQGCAYTFGGIGAPTQVRRYRFSNSTWESLPDLTTSIQAYSAVKTENDLVIFFAGVEGTTRNSLVRTYNLRTNEFVRSVAVSGVSPVARSLHTAVIYQNKMIIYAGGTGFYKEYFKDIWSFDIASSVWTELVQYGTPPKGRTGHGAVVTSEGIMVIYGGFNARYDPVPAFYNDVAYYDIRNNTWLNISVSGTPPNATYDFGCVITSNNIMIVFGGTCNGIECYPENSLARFDINTSTWIPSNALNTEPIGRSGMGYLLLYDAYFLIFGGLREGSQGKFESRDDLAYYLVNTIGESSLEISSVTEEQTGLTVYETIRPPKDSSSNSDTSVIGAVVGTVVAVVMIIVAAAIFLLLRKKRELNSQNSMNSDDQFSGVNLEDFVKEVEDGSSTNYTKIILSTPPNTADAKEILTWEINWSEIDLERELGRGAFGVVYKGQWRMQMIAVKKVIGEFSDTLVEEFIEEAKLMSKLRPHENVVQFLGISRDPLAIITSFYEGGSLSSFLLSQNTITEYETVDILLGIASGMQHLHIERIIHRDLAARNILISKEENNWKAVVSDFGFARAVLKSEGHTQSDIGPVRWMSPESILLRQYSTKSDVWSFGVLVWEVITRGALPWGQYDDVGAILAINSGIKMQIPSYCPKELADLICLCWKDNPDDRPTFQQIYSILMSYDNLLKG